MTREQKAQQLADRFDDQCGRCYYCLRPMWLPTRERSSEASARLNVGKALFRKLQATREHLVRRADSGTDDVFNIVAACMECNGDRGIRSVLEHLKARRQRYVEDCFNVYN